MLSKPKNVSGTIDVLDVKTHWNYYFISFPILENLWQKGNNLSFPTDRPVNIVEAASIVVYSNIRYDFRLHNDLCKHKQYLK